MLLCGATERGRPGRRAVSAGGSLTALALGLLTVAGCAAGEPSCRVGADCTSGVCMSDGTCARARDAGPTDAPTTPRDADLDAPLPPGDADVVGSDAGSAACTPDRDGTVTRAEIPLRAGLRANFRVASDATVSTAGTSTGDMRRWDYAGAYPGDHDVLVELFAPGGSWWAADFPTATHAARLSESSDNLGVFRITDDALLLLGVVSPESGVSQTRLTYDPPVAVIAFPLAIGSTFGTTSTVSGTAAGAFATYTEEYTSTVDAAGTLVTPFGEIAALRVRTEMERRSGVAVLTTQRQFTFVAECFGIAGVVVSRPFETEVEFTTAAEMRRLSP